MLSVVAASVWRRRPRSPSEVFVEEVVEMSPIARTQAPVCPDPELLHKILHVIRRIDQIPDLAVRSGRSSSAVIPDRIDAARGRGRRADAVDALHRYLPVLECSCPRDREPLVLVAWVSNT